MPDCDIPKLLYRDNVTLKHASRKRLADEIQSIAADPDAPAPRERKKPRSFSGGPMSKALVEYLMKAVVLRCLDFTTSSQFSSVEKLHIYT